MNDFSHGVYSLVVKDQLVICDPTGGFNESGIKKLREAIIEATQDLGAWVLLETPKDKAGLTPEATIELCNSYEIFYKKGCKAISLEVGTTFGSLFHRPPFSKLPIPIYTGKNQKELIHQACQHLLNSEL